MSNLPPDPYKVLGVSKDAQIPEIRSAHRKLILKCHPDKVQDPELKAQKQDEFQKVQKAYELLSDDKERQKYDDMIRLTELRKQAHNKPNSSAPRASPKMYPEFEVRTAEPRSSSYKQGPPPPPPGVKIYSYSRSWDDERRSGPRYYDADIRMPRREHTYSEKPSKREAEREREKERESRDKEREREKRRARKEKEAEEQRRLEKMAKKEEKKAREKQRSKEQKREKEDKRRERDGAYMDSFDEEPPLPRSDKKSSSKKHDDRWERPSHRDEPPLRFMSEEPPKRSDFARAYISRSRTDGPERLQPQYMRQPPTVPTPPPADNAAFQAPGAEDGDVRRSSARSRRGSADVPPPMPRDRSYQRSSRERLDGGAPVIVDASPTTRHPSQFSKMPPPPEMASSPPRGGISRTNTMPAEMPTRAMPHMARAQTFNGVYPESPESPANRGRGRSRLHPQAPDDSDEEITPRRAPKHRGSRKTRSPDGQEIRYQVEGGRSKLQSSTSYSRKLNMEPAPYAYHDAYDTVLPDSRPAHIRAASFASSGFHKIKTSKAFTPDDVCYSNYTSPYRNEPAAYA